MSLCNVLSIPILISSPILCPGTLFFCVLILRKKEVREARACLRRKEGSERHTVGDLSRPSALLPKLPYPHPLITVPTFKICHHHVKLGYRDANKHIQCMMWAHIAGRGWKAWEHDCLECATDVQEARVF